MVFVVDSSGRGGLVNRVLAPRRLAALMKAAISWPSLPSRESGGPLFSSPSRVSNDDDEKDSWCLPNGAAEPVLKIVGERILKLEIAEMLKERRLMTTTEANKIYRLVKEVPSLCSCKLDFSCCARSEDEKKDLRNPTLLVSLVILSAPLDLVRLVLESSPTHMVQRHIPAMRIACKMGATLEVIKFLHHHIVQAISSPDNTYGFYPLHFACANYCKFRGDGEGETVIEFLLKEYPEAATETTATEGYPLQAALLGGVPLTILKHLLRLCPESLFAVNYDGYTSLHYACLRLISQHGKKKYGLDVFSWLLEHYGPQASRNVLLAETATHRDTPLLLAARNECPEIITILLDAVGSDLDQHNLTLNCLLHEAAASNCKDAVILLADRFPWMLQVKSCGQTPLHAACECRDLDCQEDLEVLQELVVRDRRQLTARDQNNQIPAMIAYASCSTSLATKFLMEETAKAKSHLSFAFWTHNLTFSSFFEN